MPFIEPFHLQIVTRIAQFNLRLAPLGVFFLVMSTVMKKGGDLAGLAASLGAYIGTVALALAVHALVTLPLLFFIVTRRFFNLKNG